MPKVLLVDDEPNIRWTFAELLKREGFDPFTAFDFDSAMSVVGEVPIDAAVVDIILPHKSGIEILKALRSREPYVPVIMVTGEPNISQMPDIVRAGAYDFLSKPVVKDALISAVSRAVEKKRLVDEKRGLEQQVLRYTERLETAVAERTRELAQAHNFLNAVLDSSTEYALIAMDTEGRITLFNRGAELMFGRGAQKVVGTFAGELVDNTAGEVPFVEWARETQVQGRHQKEVQLLREDGGSFVGLLTTTPIMADERKLLGYLCVIKDLTVERANEERLRQMSARLAHHDKVSALGRMAAQLAHEIKNPLAGLRLYSLHLKGKIAGKIAPSEEGLVDKIIDGISQLSETAERVLNFARPISVTPLPMDLNRIVAASLAMIEHQLSAKRIAVELDLCEAGAGGVFDEAAMRSTLMNLMVNAIQAMNEGGTLKISTANTDARLRLKIADNGCGMTEEQAAHMFEPFYTTKSHGMGLGLFFAATVIEQHGGAVEVKSRAGEGTELIITFPAEGGRADGASG
jgi:two-component system sensor histidine kinase HydH